RPRTSRPRRLRLLREFTERVGDPEVGGSAMARRLTVYRQDALRCARMLAAEGVLKVGVLRTRTGLSRAGAILRDNHYGRLERVSIGHYTLSANGIGELDAWSHAQLGERG